MSEISINIITSLLRDATQLHHFNYVIKRYKKYVIESERLFKIFKDRAQVVMQMHSSPKEANFIQEMLEEVESERNSRLEFLKISGKPIRDIFDTPYFRRERGLTEGDNRTNVKESVVIDKPCAPIGIKPPVDDVNQKLDRIENKLDTLIMILSGLADSPVSVDNINQ